MSDEAVQRATAPARWLLDAGAEGVALTQTHALARALVREAAERWSDWWDAELFGPPHREADVRVLEALREGLRRLGLVRRRGRRLFSTVRGLQLAQDPRALLRMLADDLGRGDEFTDVVAVAVVDSLVAGEQRSHDHLAAAATARAAKAGWRDEVGRPPTAPDIAWVVTDVLCRGEAYGLVERHPDPEGRRWHSLFSLSEGGRHVLDASRPRAVGRRVLIFHAELVNVQGIGARLAVGAEQHLTALHDAIQEAFGWHDDHLYSFWLDGCFWGSNELEFTSPEVPDEGRATADVPIAELGLALGSRIAYVFDFGDEWRVLLTLSEWPEPDDDALPRVLARVGRAPPQY